MRNIFKDVTRLQVVNWVLQWLFIRLTRCKETKILDADLMEVSVSIKDGKIEGNPGYRINKFRITEWFAIQYWVVPLTGWSNDFRYIGKQKFSGRISKKETYFGGIDWGVPE